MNRKKLISVIIPCYCCKEVISHAINSLVQQTMPRDAMEVILVNDASVDDSLKYLLEYEQQYPDFIRVIDCKENAGIAVARNIGMDHAKGDYIAFMDQDDWIHPEMYEKMYEKAILHDCDIVSAFYEEVFGYENIPDIGKRKPEDQDILYFIETEEQRRTLLLAGVQLLGGVQVWDKLFKREFLENNNIRFLDKRLLYEDYYFMAMCLPYVKKCYILQCRYYYYLIHKNGTFLHRDKMFHLDKLLICEILLEEYKKRDFFAKFPEEIEVTFLTNYYLDGFHALFSKFNKIPVYKTKEMKEVFLKYFPNIQNNCYLQDEVIKKKVLGITGWRQAFYETLFEDKTQEELLAMGKY